MSAFDQRRLIGFASLRVLAGCLARTRKDEKNNTKANKAPTSGQSGSRIKLGAEQLNAKETVVYSAIRRSRSTLTELAEACWPRKPKAKANSWVRNSLRRLVRARLVREADAGAYAKKAA